MIHLHTLFKICALLLLPLATTAAPINEQYSVNKLINSKALFELYQGHYFPAISHLITTRKNNSLTSDDDEYELLLAGLYISFGLDSEAEKIFKERLSKTDQRKLRNQAMLLIAKLQFRQGLYGLAETTLKKVQAQLTQKQQEERLLLHGQLLLIRDKYRWSTARLRKIRNDSEWAIYGRYNLAIALIKLNDGIAGRTLLNAIGQMEAKTEDMRVLRDRANLALGYLYLQNRQSEDALLALNRVRLNSPGTSMGLLGVGWAYGQQAEYKTALSIWQRLLKNEPSSAAADEARLTTAYTYLNLKANQTALNRFEQAIEHYNREITQLDKNITSLTSGFFFRKADMSQTQLGEAWLNWSFIQSVAPSDPRLISLLNSHTFVSGVNNLRDLLFLKYTLNLWSDELNTFKSLLSVSDKNQIKIRLQHLSKERDQLTEKQHRYSQLIKGAERRTSHLDLTNYNNLHAYQDMLLNIDIMSKNRHVATGTERLMLERRQADLKMIRRFKKSGKHGQRKYDTLEKIISWQGGDAFEKGLSLSQSALANIDMKLSIVEQRKQAMLMLQAAEKSDIQANEKAINNHLDNIKSLQPKLGRAVSEQINHLTEQAIHKLTHQKQRLKQYLIRAHFHVARIHDKALGSEERSW